MIDEDNPYLGCSPDGIVDSHTLVEVKCPYSARDKMINSATVPYLREDGNGILTLSKEYNYMFQIQGQLDLCGKKVCHLVVYTFKDFKCITVPRDGEFNINMKTNLKDFYEDHFRQVLLDQYFYKNID